MEFSWYMPGASTCGGPLNEDVRPAVVPWFPVFGGALASAVRCRPCLLSCRTGNRRLNLAGGQRRRVPG